MRFLYIVFLSLPFFSSSLMASSEKFEFQRNEQSSTEFHEIYMTRAFVEFIDDTPSRKVDLTFFTKEISRERVIFAQTFLNEDTLNHIFLEPLLISKDLRIGYKMTNHSGSPYFPLEKISSNGNYSLKIIVRGKTIIESGETISDIKFKLIKDN